MILLIINKSNDYAPYKLLPESQTLRAFVMRMTMVMLSFQQSGQLKDFAIPV